MRIPSGPRMGPRGVATGGAAGRDCGLLLNPWETIVLYPSSPRMGRRCELQRSGLRLRVALAGLGHPPPHPGRTIEYDPLPRVPRPADGPPGRSTRGYIPRPRLGPGIAGAPACAALEPGEI